MQYSETTRLWCRDQVAFSVYLSLFRLQFSMALIFLPYLYTWGKELVLHFLKDGLKTLSSLHLSYTHVQEPNSCGTNGYKISEKFVIPAVTPYKCVSLVEQKYIQEFQNIES